MTGAALLLLLLISATTTGEDADLVFENEGPKAFSGLEDNLDLYDDAAIQGDDTGFGGSIQRFKRHLFGDILDFDIFSSTTASPAAASDAVRRKVEEDNIEIDLRTPNNHLRRRRSRGDDEDTDTTSGGGSGDDEDYGDRGSSAPIAITPGKELIIRVSFVVREPYQEQFSNRDSLPFQNLSRNLADGVNELFDRLPGEQSARLVRIQSRPEDSFTCKVTLELQTINFYDTDRIQDFLKRHIRDTGRLGIVIVSDEEFSYKQFEDNLDPRKDCGSGELQCRNGDCVDASLRCDGVKNCADNTDEIGCETDINEVNTNDLPTPPSVPVTETQTNAPEVSTEAVLINITERRDPVEESSTPFVSEEETYTEPEQEFTTELEETPETSTQILDVYSARCRADDQVRCSNLSVYICRVQVCDGNQDCPDGFDEIDCPSDSDCQPDEIVCDVSRCVSSSKRCDGEQDCIDGADERDCGAHCKATDFTCSDGRCVEGFRRCNRVVDCVNGEDEKNCPCMSDEFRCGDGLCIEDRRVCDGTVNCEDQSDENNDRCTSTSVSNNSWSGVHVCDMRGQFMCGDGTCLSVLLRCDAMVNCPKDSSDETDCPCTPDQWQCDFGTCVAKVKRCDGHVDCPSDRSDERNCVACSPESEFVCNNSNACISNELRCDGLKHCSDGSDEMDCPLRHDKLLLVVVPGKGIDAYHPDRCRSISKSFKICIPLSRDCNGVKEYSAGLNEAKCPCSREEFRCDVNRCVDIGKRCDLHTDCADGADEQDCPVYAIPECASDSYQCRQGNCISRKYQCDGVRQCPYGDDEDDCSTLPGQCDIRCGDGTCVPNSKRCDSIPDCNDEADERDCGPCLDNEYRCDSGLCVPQNRKCDGVSDCDDESDELDCPTVITLRTCSPNEFQCSDGTCIQDEFHCDQINDCVDGSDEINCPEKSNCGPDSVWCDGKCIDPGFVCDGNNDCTNGEDEAFCRKTSCLKSQYECSDQSCIDYSLVCNGRHDCRDGGDELECTEQGCPSTEWQCTSGECVNSQSVCDGIVDCPDGSDERLPSCSPTTQAPVTQPPYTRPPYTRPPYVRPPYTRPPVVIRTTPAPSTTPWSPIDERCRQGEWRCENGPCISSVLRCNGQVDCSYDNSDELDCPSVSQTGGLDLKTYPNDQIIRQNPYRKGGEVVFQCRDEGPLRAPVQWFREGANALPVGSTDNNGRLEMPNIQVADSGIYICRAVGYPRFTPGSELSVRLTVEPYNKIEQSRPHQSCKVNEATCSNGDCIAKNSVCNGIYDCSDGSDELACNVHGICEPNEFKCANKRCILKTWLCDSEDDCKDGSDEQQCDQGPPGAACRPHEFQCRSGRQCVPRSFHCDSEKDCLDGSDEVGCSPVYISRPPPPMMILSIHSTLTITCTAIGVPTPQVVWRLNWGHIPSKCSYNSVEGFGTLTCPDIQIEDQGAYSCEALNNRGSVFAVPDTLLVVNETNNNVCPSGYFNSEARVAQDCISCFCFGATSQCRSADLFTYQLPPPLNRGGSHLAGVVQPSGQPLQITDEPISDIFDFNPEYNGATITRIGQWSPRNIYPYLALPETYHGSQLTSYGGYIKYTVRPHGAHPPPSGYSPLPDIIIKGGDNLLTHTIPEGMKLNQENDVNVRLFQGQWKKITPYGPQIASREDIMMVLARIEAVLLRGEESGSGVDITNFQMDSASVVNSGQGSASFVEECSCPQGYSGLSCQKCSPGYSRVMSGRWLGKCVREEEPCAPGYYGNPSGGAPCRLCPCPLTNPTNQFSRTCRLEADGQVTCNCPTGYLGRRCETCAAGYIGNPTVPGDSCRLAPPPASLCDPRGTASQAGGICRCKPNVVGTRCSECANESFNLSHENIFGCSKCFCMGVTRSCSSSQWRYEQVTAKFGSQSSAQSVKLLEWDGQQGHGQALPLNALRTDSYKQEITYNQFDPNKASVYYWSLPDRFIGDKITAYGGLLTYTIRHVTENNQAPRNNAPDVQLISKNDITLVHFSGAAPGADGYLNESVQILELYWQRGDGKQADREMILMALADLESVLVKATYAEGTQQASLVTASLQVAGERGSGNRASHVEECQCPQGYLGTSCQDCAPGYTRSLNGLYLGFCELCSCNGHSDQCHPETGECLDCQHNTMGHFCDDCLPGYEGDATTGTPGSCSYRPDNSQLCRCDARGTQAPFCTGESTTCRCKPNVEGERCDQCTPGSFKLAESNPEGCSQCFCSGVTDQCNEAKHLYRQQIPTAIIDDSHGFTLTTLNQDTIIDSNFQLNIPLNQISYAFGVPQNKRLFWSLPSTFIGNKVTSYGGHITITQKFDSARYPDYSTDDTDILLVGSGRTIYWKNPNRLQSGTPLTYTVPLTESGWSSLSTGEAPRPVSRADFLSVLADLQQVLVRATLTPTITLSYIADVSMDTAVQAESGQPLAENIEVCRCPFGYSGTSCESCSAGFYRDRTNHCERCPCSGHEEACRLGPRQVVCDCRPGFTGFDCSSIDYGNATHVTSPRPPPLGPTIEVIIAAPTVENKPIGGSVRFICTATSIHSSSPLRVSWSRESGSLPLGRFIEDASRGVLFLRDLKVSDSGTYICQANDGISSAIDRATLTVPRNEVIPPQVTITPPMIEVYEGEPIELRCDVTGTPTPTLIWSRVNRLALNFQHTFENGIFRISSARRSDQGEYKCIANNAGGQDHKVVVVYVNPRPDVPPHQPVLLVSPASPVVKEGDSLTLICSADQSVPLNLITWTRDGGFLPQNFRSTNGQLLMEAIRPEDAGLYRCSADRASQRVVPASVVVTVQETLRPPQIPGTVTVDKKRSTVPEGQNLIVKCEPRGSPLPIIKWTKDASAFGPGVSQRGNALVVSHAKISDRGIYVCVGSSLDGANIAQDSAIIEVERREPPVVMVWPEGVQSVRPGSSARLQCRVRQGAPDPELIWSRPSGRPLSANTHLLVDGVLSFTSISVNEEGVYTCTGSNAAGVGSANATIKIHSPPVLTIYPNTFISVMPGKEVVLECRASGYPEPVAHWVMISPEEKIMGSETAGGAILTLPSVEEADDGTYACIARNDAGTQEERVRVTVQDNEIDSEPIRGDISGPVPTKVSIYPNNHNVTVKIGDSLKVECKGSRNINEIVWTKLYTDEYLNVETFSGGSRLLLNNVDQRDSGTYRCQGYDRDGVASIDEFTFYVSPGVVARYVPVIPARPTVTVRDWQRNPPEVHSARLGTSVSMPCITDLPTPVTFQWERPHALLPRNVQTRSPTLQLSSLSESDAGPYICRVSHRDMKMESRVILKVTHVVPRFSGDGFLALNKLKDAYFYFDIEIAIKPQDYNGIILYNSEKAGPIGDMVSLSIVDGIPEFRYILGSGSAVVIRGDRALTLDEWHKIKISRSRKDGYMYVDGLGPFSGSSTNKQQGLDLMEPLYIGGVPDYNQLPEDFTPRSGFIGCVGRLVLESDEISLMREAQEKQNIDQCDSCTPNSCQNNAVCQEALTERGYSCLCSEGYSGLDCSRTGDACHPGLCGPGRCKDTIEGYTCTCPIGYGGRRCETRIEIEYPAFGGGAFLAYATPKTSIHLKMSLRIKPNYPLKDGIILYCAESRHGHGDFTSLTLKDGFLEFRFDSGTGPVIIRSRKPLTPNEWVNVNVARVMNQGKLVVEGQEAVTGNVRGKKTLNLMTPLYVGGYDADWLTINKGTGVETGFDGCIANVKISEVTLDIIKSPIKSANVRQCGVNETEYRPHRGDIPETSTLYPTAESEGLCNWCQNGGYCAQPGDTKCTCPPGFHGVYCETAVSTILPQSSPCELMPCENGGTCRPTRQGSLYKCDCPLGTGGFQCRQRVELREDVSLTGEGYVELPASLLPHNDPVATEVIAIAFTTSEPDGLLVLQREDTINLRDGDFIMLSVNGGFVELQWELGGGVGTIQNTRIQVSDNQRHQVVVKRTALEATLEVDRVEDHGKAPGLTQHLNVDSNIYVGGIPSNMTNSGLMGFTGCIHQIEFQDSRAIHFGRTAVASRNANSCSNMDGNNLDDRT